MLLAYYCRDIYWTIMNCKHNDVILTAENRILDVSHSFHKTFCLISLLLWFLIIDLFSLVF